MSEVQTSDREEAIGGAVTNLENKIYACIGMADILDLVCDQVIYLFPPNGEDREAQNAALCSLATAVEKSRDTARAALKACEQLYAAQGVEA